MTQSKPEDANILVAIRGTDEIWIDRRLIDPRALRANIERLHAENPKGSVVIMADPKSTNKMLVTDPFGVSQATVPTMAGMVGALSGVLLVTLLTRRATREVEFLEDSLTMDH